MALKRREELEARSGVDLGRMARRGGGSMSVVVLIVVAVALALGVSIKVRHRWDFSERRDNVLAPQTLEVLTGLESDVEIYPLFTVDHHQREDYWYLLQLYRDASPKVSVEFIDPVSRPGRIASLGLAPEQESARRDGMTVVVQGENRRMFDGVTEESVTNAIMDVSTTAPRVVGFIRGYGERNPASGETDAGYGKLAVELLQEYYQLTDVVLSDGIPPEITVLMLAGPRMAIPEQDLARLAAWLEDGGRLLALMDPGSDTGINRALERWGLRVMAEPVIEPKMNLFKDPNFVKVSNYTGHAIVEGFGRNFPSVFPVVGRIVDFEPGDPLVFHEGLVLSTIVSSTMNEGVSVDGPFNLAAASWRRGEGDQSGKETRIVAVADSDFASNQYLYFVANRNLVLNCIGWLSREASLVSLRRGALADQQLNIGPEDKPRMVLAAYAAPLLVCLSGIIVYIRRRSL
jgi:hypothetical protein